MNLFSQQKVTKRSATIDESMVPAINIVFLLLIFFMIAGKIEAQKQPLTIPSSSSESELVTSEVEIQISVDGLYFLNSLPIKESLYLELQRLVLNDQSVVTVLVDRELPSTVLDPVLKAVRKLGIKNLNFATERQP